MSEPPPVQRSLLLISSVEASPAKTSAQLAKETACKVLEAVFGTSSRALLLSLLPRGWSSKISVAQLIDGWMPSALAWESLVMQAYRSRLKQKMLAPHTCGAESSLWPTVVVTDGASSARASTLANENNLMNQGTSLTDAMRTWPTPTASAYGTSGNGCPGDGREVFAHQGTPSLNTLAKSWATPTTRDVKGPFPNKRDGGRDLPTDVVNFHQAPATAPVGNDGSPKAVLNPEFVRALMGFPEGWLDVE